MLPVSRKRGDVNKRRARQQLRICKPELPFQLRTAHRHQCLSHQKRPVRRRFLGRRETDGKVEVIESEIDNPHGGIDCHADVGKLRGELFQPGQQDLVGESRRAAHRQRAGRLAAGKLLGRCGDNAERLIDERRVGFSGTGQPQAARLPVKQFDAQPAFQRLHAVTHRAGGQIEFGGGPAKAPVPRGSFKDAERTQRWKAKGHAVRSGAPFLPL